jgi:endonuclease G, mitochondrial
MDIKTFADDIAAAEERYAEREGERTETLRRLKEGGVLAADTPERVEKRLARLGLDQRTAEALARGAVPAPPASEPPSPGDLAALAPPDASVETFDAGDGDVIGLERLVGNKDLISAAFLTAGARAARPVGRILVCTERGGIGSFGTGSLVSPRLLLTNNHVLKTPEVAKRAQVEFGYELGLDGRQARGASFELQPDVFFVTDRGLDFALVAVQERNADGDALSQFGWNPMIEAEGKAIKGEKLNIVQHPNGEPKQLAIRENRLVDLLENFLHYETDTAPGSSGSPVFNDQWEIVGLHHSGVPKKDGEGRKLAVTGELWAPEMGEHRIDWIANEGVRISRIIKHVKAQVLGAEAEALRDGMFAEPPADGSGQESARQGAEQASGDGRDAVLVTIPLQLTIQVGAPEQAPGAPPA